MSDNNKIRQAANLQVQQIKNEMYKAAEEWVANITKVVKPSAAKGRQTALDVSYYSMASKNNLEQGGKASAKVAVKEHAKQDLKALESNKSNYSDDEYKAAVAQIEAYKQQALALIDSTEEAVVGYSSSRAAMAKNLQAFKESKLKEFENELNIRGTNLRKRVEVANKVDETFRVKANDVIRKEISGSIQAVFEPLNMETNRTKIGKTINNIDTSFVKEVLNKINFNNKDYSYDITLEEGFSQDIDKAAREWSQKNDLTLDTKGFKKLKDDLSKAVVTMHKSSNPFFKDQQLFAEKTGKSQDKLNALKGAKPNQYIVDTFKTLGKDVDGLVHKELSVPALQEAIIEKYGEVGIGVKFEGHKAILYSLKKYNNAAEAIKADKETGEQISEIEFGFLDASGSIRKGNMATANITYATQLFNGKGKAPTPALISAYEMQYKNLLDLLGRDNNGKIVQQFQTGNMKSVSGIARNAIKDALEGAPSATTSTVRNEAIQEVAGMKNPEQMAAIKGLFTVKDLAEGLFAGAKTKQAIQDLYDRLEIKRTVDPYNMSQEEYNAVTTAYSLVTMGLEDKAGELKDGLLKAILELPEFQYFRDTAKTFAKYGLTPSFESLKEESYLSGFLTVGGSHDILPLNIFGDNSNRALNQIFNYNERAHTPNAKNDGRQMVFTSQVGRDLGVDYNKTEMTQYVGATTTDKELLEAFKELSKEMNIAIEGILPSVEEGGIIIPQSMAKELTAYRTDNAIAYREDIDSLFLKKTLGLNPEDLDNLGVGKAIYFDNLTIGEDDYKDFSKEYSLAVGDNVVGIKKLDDGFMLLNKHLELVNEGTKLLVEGGGRQTARIVEDSLFEKLTEKLGQKGAKFLTEKKSLSSKNFMPDIRGRLSYLITEAMKSGGEYSDINKVLEVLKKTTQIGKSFTIVDGKLQSSAFYDKATNSYKYYDEVEQKVKDLFTPGKGESIDDVIRKAFIETENGSDFQKLGKTLLGDTKYQESLGKTAQFINTAKEYPYFDAIGSGNANLTEREGRVKFADRERKAVARTFSDAEATLVAEGMKDGLRLFMQDEERQMNSYGKKGLAAQEKIKEIESALDTQRTGFSKQNRNQKVLEIGVDDYGNLTFNGEVYEGEYKTSLNWNKEKGGYTEEEYQKSIMAIARNEAAKIGAKDITLKYGNQSYLLADMEGTKMHNGAYTLSEIEKANNALLRGMIDGTLDSAEDQLKKLFDSYEQIARDKDSELFKTATQSLVNNASYSKVIGQNMALSGEKLDKANTFAVTSEHVRSLLGVENKSDTESLVDNIKNLSYMLKASGASGIEDYSKLSSKQKGLQELQELETKLIEQIINRVKKGEMELLSQVHRYPSTSGRDVRFSGLTIDDNLGSDDIMAISRGLALTVNADYDGDKMYKRILFASSKYGSYEDFKQAYEAAKRIKELDDQVARHMEEWDIAQKKRDSEEEAHYEQLRKKVGLNKASENEIKEFEELQAKSDINKLVKDLSNREPNYIASLMSKANKKYVGQFSNVATNTRNFMTEMGMDEGEKAGSKSAVQSAMIRAYLETLEQDSISAKKVFQRLSGEKGEQVAIDELDSLYELIVKGEFQKAIEKSQDMGFKFEESRQLEFAIANLKAYNPKLYESTYQDIFEGNDAKAKKEAVIRLLTDSFSSLNKLASDKHLSGEDIAYNTFKRRKAIDARDIRKYSRDKSEDKVNKNSEKLAEEIKKTTGYFEVGRAENQPDHETTHFRKVGIGREIYEDENVDSVTQLLSVLDPEKPAWEKAQADYAANKGTYAHKLAEIMGSLNVTSIDEVENYNAQTEEEQKKVDEAIKEIKLAKNELKRAIGFDATPELMESMQKRAESLAKVAQEEGLFGETAKQEVTLGGKFSGIENALAGQADIIASTNEGMVVGDYKFSSQGDTGTVAKRILQASIYLALYEKELDAEYSELLESVKAGKELSEDTSVQENRLKEIESEFESIKKGRKVKILRSFEKNGEIFNEVLTVDALTAEEALKKVGDLQGYKETQAKIDSLKEKLESAKSNKDRKSIAKDIAKLEKQLNNFLKENALIDVEEIIDASGASQDSFKYKRASDGKIVSAEQAGRGEKSNSNARKAINSYIRNLKSQYKTEEDIQKAQNQLQGKTGAELVNQQAIVTSLQDKLNYLKSIQITLNEEEFSEEQLKYLEEERAKAAKEHAIKQNMITASLRNQQSFLQKLVGGFKNQITMFIDTSLAYQAIGRVRSAIRELIQTTEQLDKQLVDIQIATGYSRQQTRDMLIDYNDMARELGRTTSEVAAASNDWLRAGYEGQEAAELTKASMMLSTLGMIDASEATKYLISTLKGWRIEANEVINIVDKLSAVDMSAAINLVATYSNIWLKNKPNSVKLLILS